MARANVTEQTEQTEQTSDNGAVEPVENVTENTQHPKFYTLAEATKKLDKTRSQVQAMEKDGTLEVAGILQSGRAVYTADSVENYKTNSRRNLVNGMTPEERAELLKELQAADSQVA